MDGRNQERLGQAPVGRLLLEYALPSIVSVSIAALNNFVDTVFIGRYVGEVAVAATTVAFPVMLLISAVGMWIGVGGTANGALRLGEGRPQEAERYLANNLVMLVGAAVLIALVGTFFLEPFLRFCGATDTNMAYSKAFSTVIIYGAILQLPGLGLNNFIRTDGSPNVALVTILTGGIINVILNFVFVAWLGFGIAGSALATVLGQGASTVLIIRYFLSPRSYLKLRAKNMRPHLDIVGATLALGLSSFALQFATAFINIFVNSQIAYFGANDPLGADGGLAVIGTVLKIVALLLMPIMGVSIAMQPLLGYNYGARKYARVERTFLTGWLASTVFVTCVWIFVQVDPAPLISIFGMPPEYNRFGEKALRLVMAFMPLIPLQVLGPSYFQSTGQPFKSTLLSLSRKLLLYGPFVYLIPRYLEPHIPGLTPLESIVMATPASDSISVFIVTSFLVYEFKKLRRLVREEQAEQDAPSRDAATLSEA